MCFIYVFTAMFNWLDFLFIIDKIVILVQFYQKNYKIAILVQFYLIIYKNVILVQFSLKNDKMTTNELLTAMKTNP